MIPALPPGALTLDTPRLRLTPCTPEDVDIMTALLCDPEVMQFVDDAYGPDQMHAVMQDAIRRGAGGRIGTWIATRKDTGQKIGDAVLTPVPIDEDKIDFASLVADAYPDAPIETGYLLIPSAWGQGFATEICSGLLQFAFTRTTLSKVVATTDPDNARSQHVLTKCGMTALGLRRAYALDDVSWFEITRAAWQARAPAG